jgi:hypothetical protein
MRSKISIGLSVLALGWAPEAMGSTLIATAVSPSISGTPLCPEHPAAALADSTYARLSIPQRERFRPDLERPSSRGDSLIQEVDSLFQAIWDHGRVRPHSALNGVIRSVSVEVHAERNTVEGQPWAEMVLARQIAYLERMRITLSALDQGTVPATNLLRGLKYLTVDLLLSCPRTLRDRRVEVVGTVIWRWSRHSPRQAEQLILKDQNWLVPLVWAGLGPVAEIDPTLFSRFPGVYSWWSVSIGDQDGETVLFLHDFLGIKEMPATPTSG